MRRDLKPTYEALMIEDSRLKIDDCLQLKSKIKNHQCFDGKLTTHLSVNFPSLSAG
jgi:hypothetical protein